MSISSPPSGRAPLKLTLERLSSEGYSPSSPLPVKHAHNVTVPGAAAGWVDTVERFGSGKVRVISQAVNVFSCYIRIRMQV